MEENRKYIIRGDRSGVFYGEIEDHHGQEVIMRNARCLWWWGGAASILQIAAEGVKYPSECKFTMTVERLILTDVIETIPCTDAACASIDGVPEWKI